jgi:formyltetrahydrofolate synthetase
MAILCLAGSPADLRTRLDRILVGFTKDGQPVLAKQIRVVGSMAAILNEAILPNLVQTTESVPAFIHGGPFANIAHGCNSVVATRMALTMADYAVTEAGFAFDLGGEKFFDLKCRTAGLNQFATDTLTELGIVHAYCESRNVPCATANVLDHAHARPARTARGRAHRCRCRGHDHGAVLSDSFPTFRSRILQI